MTHFRKTAAWAAVGIVGGGAAAGIGYAAMTAPAAAGSTATASAGSPAPPRQAAGMRLGGRAMFQRLEHGELTLQAPRGDRTVNVQRGAVSTVTPSSVTVVSHDGFTRTYVVTSATRVRGGHGRESIGDVHQGDTVFVVADGTHAIRILDR